MIIGGFRLTVLKGTLMAWQLSRKRPSRHATLRVGAGPARLMRNCLDAGSYDGHLATKALIAFDHCGVT